MSELEKDYMRGFDFKQEVINSERLRDNFHGYKGLYVPKTHVQDSTKRAIITEYVEGVSVKDFDKLVEIFDRRGLNDIANRIQEIFARMIFLHGHVNEDFDPSNILVRKMKDGSPEVVLLDHCRYCSVEKELRISYKIV